MRRARITARWTGYALAAVVAATCLLSAEAYADDEREAAARVLVGAAFPTWLALAGGFTPDMAAVRSASERSVAGLASQLPENCDVARMKRDVCGIHPVNVSSSSMVPALQVRDVVAVMTGDFAPVRRGDVLVHDARYHNATEETRGLSRVIGLPGETVELRGGRIFIDGTELAQRETGGSFTTDLASGAVFTETTPEGRSYAIGIATPRPETTVDDFGPVTLPAQRYFVMGDNRYNSVDSRYPDIFNGDGLVAQSAIVGIAVSVLAAGDGARIGLPLR